MTSNPPSRRRKAGESGYAMLLVFLMAAFIAIALYKEMPRVAFENQRAKEQLLIERGEQYKRAIQLFVRKMSRYPATIEELEDTNNIRFLRRRYVDPMTGKDKWRLVHINGGVLTDSIIQKNKPGLPGQNQGDQPQANTNTFIAEGPAMGGANDPSQQQVNPGMRRRASDDRPVVTTEAPEQPQQEAEQNGDENDNNNNVTPENTDNNDNNDDNSGTNPNANAQPGVVPNQPGMYPPGTMPRPGVPNPAFANQPYGARYAPGAPGTMPNQGMPNQGMPYQGMPNQGMPNQISSPGMSGGFPQPAYPGQNSDTGSSSSGVYAAPGLGQSPSTPAVPMPTIPGQPPGMVYPNQPQSAYPGAQQTPFGQAGPPPGTIVGGFGQNPAGNLPPGAAPQNGISMSALGLSGPSRMGPQGSTAVPGMGGAQMGGGIAGVASESKGPSIIVYAERKKYNEWEFVYDQSKDRGLAGVQRGGGAPGTPAGQMGSMPNGLNPQQSGFGQQGGAFGQQGGAFGQSGGFGQQGGAFGQSGGFGQSTPQQPQPQPQPQQPPN